MLPGALGPAAADPVWAVGSSGHLALGNGHLRCSNSSSRWSARFTAACNVPSTCGQARVTPPPPPAPGKARPRGPTSCCFRRLRTASSFFARASFTLRGRGGGGTW